MRHLALAVSIIFTPSYLIAQSSQGMKAGLGQEVPSVTLEFGKAAPTALGNREAVMSANYICADDGSIFLEIAETLDNTMLVLHALKGPSEDVRFLPGKIHGYGTISFPLKYFVNDYNVAALVEADYEINSLEENAHEDSTAHLVLIYDRKGVLQNVVTIPPGIDVKSIGLYRSGDLLIVAINRSSNTASLFVLDNKGNIKHKFLLFDNDYNRNAKTEQPLADLIPDGALAFLQIIPHGENLLLFPQMTSHEILEVNESGVVRSVHLQLPAGATLASFLSSTDTSWKIKTIAKTDAKGILHEGPVYEFNSSDGSLIRRIDMPNGARATLACEHDGEYTALTTEENTGRLEFLSGSISK